MKRWIILPLLALSLLVLSGCALGSRRDRAAPPTETPVAAQPAGVTEPAALEMETAAPIDTEPLAAPATTAPTLEPAADQPAADALGQQALDQLNALDAANQAGDALEELP